MSKNSISEHMEQEQKRRPLFFSWCIGVSAEIYTHPSTWHSVFSGKKLCKTKQAYCATESIEWFVEDHVFSPSYELAPLPTPPSHSCLQVFLVLLVAGPAYWRERGGGGGGIAKSYDGEKAGPL